jgi:hypothetical protein
MTTETKLGAHWLVKPAYKENVYVFMKNGVISI